MQALRPCCQAGVRDLQRRCGWGAAAREDAIAIARAAGHQALGEMLASGVDAPAEPAAAPS